MTAGTTTVAANTDSSAQKPILRQVLPDGLFTNEANHSYRHA